MDHSFCIGGIYPDDLWVDRDIDRLVAEFRFFLPEGIKMVTARTYVPEVPTNAAAGKWLAENGEIEEAARRLMCCEPTCFAYFCTTASFIRGVGFDRDINQRITQATGRPATSTSTAMIQALKSLDVTRIALASPYLPDVEAAFIAFLQGHGFEIVNSVAMNLSTDHSRVEPHRMRVAVEEADRPEAEAVFVGCTGQRVGRLLDSIEDRLGKPVLSANQVTVWHALQLIDREPVVPGRGSLFAKRD